MSRIGIVLPIAWYLLVSYQSIVANDENKDEKYLPLWFYVSYIVYNDGTILLFGI